MIDTTSDQEAEKILSDNINFKLFMAESYLKKIKPNIPLNFNHEYLLLESNIESFLFFSVGALDILWNEINRTLKLGIEEQKIDFDKIKTNLNHNEDKRANLILSEIEKNFTPPSHTEQKMSEKEYVSIIKNQYSRFKNITWKDNTICLHIWNRNKSSLWEIKTLRNYITHYMMLRRSSHLEYHNESNIKQTNYLIIPMRKYAILPFETEEIENPFDYFSKSFDLTKKFIESIRQILNKKC